MDSDAGKLFIGGISWETTEEKLKNYFSRYGAVVEAIIMKDRTTGRARGFGFIIYADPAVVDKVVQQKHSIDGRTVEAKKAVPKDEQQNAFRSSNGSIASPNQARTKKIFVGGLAHTVTESDFRKYFEQFGSITDVVVMYDNSTQRPRGFGFITYTSEDAVENVLQNTFHELKDKMVEVKRAIPKELSPGPMRNTVNGFNSGIARGLFGAGYVHGLNSPISPYGTRMGGRYGLSMAGDYSPYGTTYSNFNINPAYSASPYGGVAEFTWGGGPNIGSLYGGGQGGYSGNMPARTAWSTRGIGYASSGTSPYGGMDGASTLGDFRGFRNWGSLQSPNSGGRYSTSNSGYGRIDSGYGSGGLGYTRGIGDYGSTVGSRYGSSIDGGHGSATGSLLTSGSGSGSSVYSGGYADFYSGTSYAEASRKSSSFGTFNPSGSLGPGELGYGLSVSSSEVAAAGYSDGYAPGRQPNRGIPA